MMVLAFLFILFTVVFGGTHKLDYELLKAVKENKETLTAKSLILKSAGKDLVVREVKVLTKDGKVKVVDLSKRPLMDLMNDPNIVYIEAPRPVSLKNDIVRNISYGVHGSANTSLSINSNTNYFVYVNPSGITTSQSNACILLGQVLSSDLFSCSGSETLDISQDFRAVVVGVDKASISGYSEIYLVGTKSTLTLNDGSGVIVGVIDSGINFCHPAFLDINGNTRVRFFGLALDNNLAGILAQIGYCTSSDPGTCCSELGGNYLQTGICELDQNAITQVMGSGKCNFDFDLLSGHGTHVAGIAAGSDYNNPLFGIGIAPGADLVVCTPTNDTGIIKCLEWIKAKSQALNQPTVVNMSLGTHQDPHDGTGLLDKKVDELSGSGFIVVVAQSNEGNKPIHAYITKTSDIIRIQVPEITLNNQTFYLAVIYGWYENPSKWEIALCEPGTNNCVKAKSGEDIANQQIGNTGCSASISMSIENDPLNGDGRFKIEILCNSSQYLDLKLTQICGYVARVDMWDLCGDNLQCNPPGIFLSNTEKDILEGYKFTVASPGTAKRAITVGAINSRPDNSFDLDPQSGLLRFDTFPNLGKIANFSSRGPTRDGRIKPNVVAGGAYVISANANFDPTNPGTLYVQMQGTSMATPVVTGLVALYLQDNPQATPEDVKKWLTSNAEWDVWDFGISYPNEIYGHGKAVWSDNVGLSGSSQDVLVNIPKGEGIGSCQTPTGGDSGSIGDGNGGSLEEVINDSSGGGGGCFTVSAGYVLLSAFMISFLVVLRRYYFS